MTAIAKPPPLPTTDRGTGLSYDAVEDTGRRKQRPSNLKSEERVLLPSQRKRLIGTTRDVTRNFAIAAWMIRQHLNYVASFTFQAKTGNDDFNTAVEKFVTTWSRRENCDVAGRHPFRRIIRLWEGRRAVDGDCGILKLSDGKIQAIEGDRIRNGVVSSRGIVSRNGVLKNSVDEIGNLSTFDHGVELDEFGKAKRYAIWNRTRGGGYRFVGIRNARDVILHGFFDRFDQVRGVSPIVAALNSLQDVYEGFDYALAKAKVSQLFALVFFRNAVEGFEGTTATEDADGDGTNDSKYEVDFGKGPVNLDLDPGEDAKFLESKEPSTQFVDFETLAIQVALKAFDIPFSFFDESHSTFYGSRAGLIQYLKSCKAKRLDLSENLDDLIKWRLGLAIADGDLVLPADFDLDAMQWEWVPDGVPWWDPVKEVKGAKESIEAGFTSPQQVCKAIGTDFFENVDEIAAALEFAEERFKDLDFTLSYETVPETVEVVEVQNNAE